MFEIDELFTPLLLGSFNALKSGSIQNAERKMECIIAQI
jgi:hypothetical protein